MANEITTQQTSLTGATVYCTIDQAGLRWNGSAFESVLLAHWATYKLALTEAAGTGYFMANMPTAIPAGLCFVTLYRQAGGAPAATDATVGSGQIDWDGSATGVITLTKLYELLKGFGVPCTVSATPTPTQTAFTVVLDNPLSGSTQPSDLNGLYLNFKEGSANSVRPLVILNSTITDTTHVALTFTPTGFPVVPAAGDRCSISS